MVELADARRSRRREHHARGGSSPSSGISILELNMNTDSIVANQLEILDKTWLVDRTTIKKHIKRIIKEWKPILGISNWDIRVTFFRETHAATCAAQPEYLKIHLNFYLKLLLKPGPHKPLRTNYDLEEFVVHEMIHGLSWNLVSMLEYYIERSEEPHRELLEEQKEKAEEFLMESLSTALVLSKYGLRSKPNHITIHGMKRHK